MTGRKIHIDVTKLVCPMTFARIRVSLDQLSDGEVLVARLNGRDTVENVPTTALAQGHRVLAIRRQSDRTTTIEISRRDRRNP